MTLETLHQELIGLGAKPVHYGHLYRALFGVVPWPAGEDPKFPKELRKALPAIKSKLDSILTVVESHQAQEEQSLKLLFRLQDGQTIESVLLPREGLCVSSQVGLRCGVRVFA